MKGELDYVIEEKFRGKWLQLKGVRILPETADELNRDTHRTGIRYVKGKFQGSIAESVSEPEKSLEDLSVKELMSYAEEKQIELNGAKKKTDIVFAIRSHERAIGLSVETED